MNPMMRTAAAAVILVSGLGSLGCVHTGGGGGATVGDRWRNAVDPCYPERYNHAARQAVLAPFAQQVHNGHVLNQTVYNYYFEFGTDKLTPAGMEKLISIARTRPAPDPKLYLQTARDIPATTAPEKIADVRAELDSKRGAAIQKYMAGQPAFAPVSYEIFVHDPATPSINSEMGLRAYNGSFRGYTGGVTGSGGVGSVGTGGGGTNLTTGGGTTGGGSGGTAGTGGGYSR